MDSDGVEYIYGVDINSNWEFSNGDLNLAKYDDNLVQAIINRLNTGVNELDLLYDDYGSVLLRFLGFKNKTQTLNLIKLEIENCLKDEPRLSNFEVDVNYNLKGNLKIKLHIYGQRGEINELNLIINNEMIEVDE